MRATANWRAGVAKRQGEAPHAAVTSPKDAQGGNKH